MSWLKRSYAILVARNKEFYRDHGTLGWNFIFPVVLILGFAFGYAGRSQDLFKAGIYRAPGVAATERGPAGNLLGLRYLEVVPMPDLEQAIHKVERHQVDILVAIDGPGEARYWINSTSPKGYFAERLLLGPAADAGGRPGLRRQTVEGREPTYVEWLIPGILAMNMMFSSLFGVGYTIVRYRKNGVLKRLKATPVRPFEFLAAQLVSRLLLILFTLAVVTAGAFALVRFQMNGSWLTFLVFMTVGAVCMISLSLVIAARIASEELAEGLLNLLTWPMMLLSGSFFSLEGASRWVLALSKAMPLTHIVDGARAILFDGAGLAQLGPELAVLGGLSVLFLAIGSAVFRWS